MKFSKKYQFKNHLNQTQKIAKQIKNRTASDSDSEDSKKKQIKKIAIFDEEEDDNGCFRTVQFDQFAQEESPQQQANADDQTQQHQSGKQQFSEGKQSSSSIQKQKQEQKLNEKLTSEKKKPQGEWKCLYCHLKMYRSKQMLLRHLMGTHKKSQQQSKLFIQKPFRQIQKRGRKRKHFK